MNNVLTIKKEINNIKKDVSSLINQNIRIDLSKFYQNKNSKDVRVSDFCKTIISYFENIKNDIKEEYINAINDMNLFIDILYSIEKSYKSIAKLQSQISYGTKLVALISKFINMDFFELKNKIDEAINKLLELRKRTCLKTEKRDHVAIYNFLNKDNVERYGDVLLLVEKLNDNHKTMKIKKIIERDNKYIEEIDYLLIKLNEYKKELWSEKNLAYIEKSLLYTKQKRIIEKKRNLMRKISAKDNDNSPFAKLKEFADNISDTSLNILVLSCFSLNLFDVKHLDKHTNELVNFEKIEYSTRETYIGYFNRWIKELEYYLNGKYDEE